MTKPHKSGMNYGAWEQNALAFIKARRLEIEFRDWCGGWPMPPHTSLADEVVQLARELVSPAGMVNRGVDRGLVVVEKADKSDPHYRLCAALDRLVPAAGSRSAGDSTGSSSAATDLNPPGEVELREALERAATSLRTQGVGYTLDGNALMVLVHGFGRIDFGPVILAALTTRRAQTEGERVIEGANRLAKRVGAEFVANPEKAARLKPQTEGE